MYRYFCAAVLLSYTVLEWRGVDFFPPPQHAAMPMSFRSSPGGYRSYYYGSPGFQGGK